MNKNNLKNMNFETLAVHGGVPPCPQTGATVAPIYQTASYAFPDAQHAADVFGLKKAGFVYSRLTNPTVSMLEEKIAMLEGGTGATCTAAGLSASFLVAYTLMSGGDDFIASEKLYGGTCSQFRDSFKRSFDWNCLFTDLSDPETLKAAITERTKFIFVESVSNPESIVIDIEALARIAESAGLPLVVDNTIPTPYLCRPFDYGASIITHSTTKYLSGHGHAMGGAVVDGGTFDWMKHGDKFEALTGDNHGYPNTLFARDFSDAPFATHNHAVGLRDLGINQQAMNAWLTLLGMETLPLRMERHSENALKIAEFLEEHPHVSWVKYSGLASSPHNALAQKYLKDGQCSSLFTFGLKGGYKAGVELVNNTNIFANVANLGDTHSLIIHPASTTHAQLPPEHREKAGVGDDVIRIAIGIENCNDLIADLEQALQAVQKNKAA